MGLDINHSQSPPRLAPKEEDKYIVKAGPGESKPEGEAELPFEPKISLSKGDRV